MSALERPTPAEYDPWYADYVAAVPDGQVLDLLAAQLPRLRASAAVIPPERETYRYAPGKWSFRQVFGHLGDAERVFGYRLCCVSRGEQAPLPGFDEGRYVAEAPFESVPLAALLDELALLRGANLALMRTLPAEAWARTGMANGKPISARALAYVIAGHLEHHLRVLAERYGVAVPPASATA